MILDSKAIEEIVSSISKKCKEAGLKLISEIRKGDLYGNIFENDQFLDMDTLVIQSHISAPSGVLMLTFSLANTEEEKEWAFLVIESVKHYKR